MLKELQIALRATLFTLFVTGLVYPLAVTLLAQALFHHRASGSFIEEGGKTIGSELIAQPFKSPAYFQPRPSSAGDNGFDAKSSSGSNLGPTSIKLRERAGKDVARLRAENPDQSAPVPIELVTASGSGLDPHLSPEAALWQAPRIARARGVSLDRVSRIVAGNVEGLELGFLGETTINVLLLNIALDQAFGKPHSGAP